MFLTAMDRSSISPRIRLTTQRMLADRSLPNTPFSLYPDEPGRTLPQSSRGRRHFARRGERNLIAPDPPITAPCRLVPQQVASHLSGAAQLMHEEGEDEKNNCARFTRQRCREPPFDRTPFGTPRQRHTITGASSLRQSHLSLGSLAPKEERQKERLPPPLMVKKPLRHGRRYVPAPRSMSAECRRVGVKMVPPPSHWESATEKRLARAIYGLDAQGLTYFRHRNQSNWNIGSVTENPLGRAKSLDIERGGEAERKRACSTSNTTTSGRRYSSTPRQRRYDIISWRPL